MPKIEKADWPVDIADTLYSVAGQERIHKSVEMTGLSCHPDAINTIIDVCANLIRDRVAQYQKELDRGVEPDASINYRRSDPNEGR